MANGSTSESQIRVTKTPFTGISHQNNALLQLSNTVTHFSTEQIIYVYFSHYQYLFDGFYTLHVIHFCSGRCIFAIYHIGSRFHLTLHLNSTTPLLKAYNTSGFVFQHLHFMVAHSQSSHALPSSAETFSNLKPRTETIVLRTAIVRFSPFSSPFFSLSKRPCSDETHTTKG